MSYVLHACAVCPQCLAVQNDNVFQKAITQETRLRVFNWDLNLATKWTKSHGTEVPFGLAERATLVYSDGEIICGRYQSPPTVQSIPRSKWGFSTVSFCKGKCQLLFKHFFNSHHIYGFTICSGGLGMGSSAHVSVLCVVAGTIDLFHATWATIHCHWDLMRLG